MPDYSAVVIDGEALRRILDTRLWSLRTLATESGVSYRAVKYAVSETPNDSGSRRTMRRTSAANIAAALDVDMGTFSRPARTEQVPA